MADLHIVDTKVGLRAINLDTAEDERVYRFTDLELGEVIDFSFKDYCVLILRLPPKSAAENLKTFKQTYGLQFDGAMIRSEPILAAKIASIESAAEDITITPKIKQAMMEI